MREIFLDQLFSKNYLFVFIVWTEWKKYKNGIDFYPAVVLSMRDC